MDFTGYPSQADNIKSRHKLAIWEFLTFVVPVITIYEAGANKWKHRLDTVTYLSTEVLRFQYLPGKASAHFPLFGSGLKNVLLLMITS